MGGKNSRSSLNSTAALAELVYGDRGLARKVTILRRRHIDVNGLAMLLETPTPHEYVADLGDTLIPSDRCDRYKDACRAAIIVVGGSVIVSSAVFADTIDEDIENVAAVRLRADLRLVTSHELVDEVAERLLGRVKEATEHLYIRILDAREQRAKIAGMSIRGYVAMLRRYWDTPVAALMGARRAVLRALLSSTLYDYLAAHYTKPRLMLDKTLVFTDEDSLASKFIYGQRDGDTLLAEASGGNLRRVAEERLRTLTDEWLAANKHDLKDIDEDKLAKLIERFISDAVEGVVEAFNA